MTRSLRIAVLECDTPIPPVQSRLGNYGDIFEGLVTRGLETYNDSTIEIQEISKWYVVENPVYPDPNQYNAFLLMGSSIVPYPLTSRPSETNKPLEYDSFTNNV